MVYKTDITSWTANVEKILTKQYNKCAAYKWMHDYDSDSITVRNKRLNILSILLVSVSATTSLATNNASQENAWIFVINIVYPVLLYISTVISSLQHFLNYEKEAEKHRTASLRYNALYNNLVRMLALEVTQRQQVNDYFNWVTKEYDNIFSSSPDISDIAKGKFKKEFNINIDDFGMSNHTADKVVEVLTLTEIKPLTESEKIKYELERFMVNSYNC